MKILYAIQGTGNGHISRARDIIPALKKQAEVDVLISGIQADVALDMEVNYRLKGMSFIFGKKGNVDLVQTFRKCITRKFLREVSELPLAGYDLIVNDFEPVTAWAARLKGTPCLALSHQFAVLQPEAPKPKKMDWVGKMVLGHYAPVRNGFGFHFKKYANQMFTPVIRQEIRQQPVTEEDHVTVYLPAYDNERIVKVLSDITTENWQVFSKHTRKEWKGENIWIRPIDNPTFLQSMASCKAVLCGAGFETPAEAIYMGKKLMVIPMKNQYEQQCNAAALAEMGIRTLKSLKRKYVLEIKDWLVHSRALQIDFPDETDLIVQKILGAFNDMVPEDSN